MVLGGQGREQVGQVKGRSFIWLETTNLASMGKRWLEAIYLQGTVPRPY